MATKISKTFRPKSPLRHIREAQRNIERLGFGLHPSKKP